MLCSEIIVPTFLIPLIWLMHCTRQIYQHLKIIVFGYVQWFSWVHRCQCFRGICCPHLQGWRECRLHIPLLCWYTCTVLYNIVPRRQYFSYLPWKRQVLHQCYCFEKGSLVMLMFLSHFFCCLCSKYVFSHIRGFECFRRHMLIFRIEIFILI
jgi:hypothetical protein